MNARDRQLQAWLQETLGQRPDSFVPASSDASFRRYFRIRIGDQTRIVMDAPPPQEDCRPFVQVSAVLRDANLQVPEIFAADLQQGFLLLSDLGDVVYLDALTTDNSDELYTNAIVALLQMQMLGKSDELPEYDRPRLHDEMQLFVDWFCVRHLQLDCDASVRATFDEAFGFLIGEALAQPQVLVHRDYHSRNLMLLAGDKLGILDYQDAVHGPIAYDLASLLRDVYVRLPKEQIESKLALYHLAARGESLLGGASLETLTRWFDLIGVQRHLKIAGIFARLYYRDSKPRYLADIELTLDYLLEVAGQYPQLAALVALLEKFEVRERNRQRVERIYRE